MQEAGAGSPPARAATGIAGLDDVLGGGLTRDRLYLVEGDPGAGKTTLALQYLREGARLGERGLYVTLSETEEELREVAQSHGWSLDGIDIFELVASEDNLSPDAQYTMFHPSEVELSNTTGQVLEQVEQTRPQRIVFDSLSEFRLLAQNALRYRRQILALKQFFTGRRCTVLLLDDRTSEGHDLQLQSIAHGVVTLEQLSPGYGAERRRLRVVKLRGMSYRGGYHDFTIVKGGLRVFPRLVAPEHGAEVDSEQVASGVPALDALLGGGPERGTSVLLLGPAGAGKTSIATQYALAAAAAGEHAAIFTFDESAGTLLARCAGMAMPLAPHVQSGRVRIQQIDPAELSPGAFADTVQRAVEADRARVLVIDSLNGYLNAMPEERFLTIQLHQLLMYLGQKGVLTFLVAAQHGLLGSHMESPIDASYLADSVLLFRHFEATGEVRRALSVMKKRRSGHENSIRELRLTSSGIQVGEPLREYCGLLTGTPVLTPGPSAEAGRGGTP